VAPVLLIFTKPSIPNEEGNNFPNHTQYSGIADFGQEIPEININGTDVNTNIKKGISRSRLKNDIAIAKKGTRQQEREQKQHQLPPFPHLGHPEQTRYDEKYPITHHEINRQISKSLP